MGRLRKYRCKKCGATFRADFQYPNCYSCGGKFGTDVERIIKKGGEADGKGYGGGTG